MMLDGAFLRRPLAHRGYHDLAAGRAENSRAAALAAIDSGYGIECDLQLSSDGVPMAFHDYELNRLCGVEGLVQQKTAAELGALKLTGGDETIPTLAEFLDLVAGRAPLLIEIKDQDMRLGPDLGELERAVAEHIKGYRGPLALMSFNPHSMAHMAELSPQVPRGLTTCSYLAQDWPMIPEARRAQLRQIVDFDRVGACFISHQHNALSDARVTELKATGVPVLCWTVRSQAAENKAREVAGNVTFEGYAAA